MWRPFLCSKLMEDNKEELRPSKMRGVAFPKAKYGVILASITPYLALGNATPLIFEGLSSSLLSSISLEHKKGRHI